MGLLGKSDEEKKAAAEKEAAEKEAANDNEGKGFIVVDSNGKNFRTVKTKKEAEKLAKHIGGRVK